MDKKLLLEIISDGIKELNRLSTDYLINDPSKEEIQIAIEKTELILKEFNLLKSKSQNNNTTTTIESLEIEKSSHIIEEEKDITVEEEIITIRETQTQGINIDKDIRDYIGINDKFLFIRELFDGNNNAYNETLETINTTNNIEDLNHLISKKEWDSDNESTKLFCALINKKFS